MLSRKTPSSPVPSGAIFPIALDEVSRHRLRPRPHRRQTQVFVGRGRQHTVRRPPRGRPELAAGDRRQVRLHAGCLEDRPRELVPGTGAGAGQVIQPVAVGRRPGRRRRRRDRPCKSAYRSDRPPRAAACPVRRRAASSPRNCRPCRRCPKRRTGRRCGRRNGADRATRTRYSPASLLRP